MTSNTLDRLWATHEVEEILGVPSSTLRNWFLLLEQKGYSFAKNKGIRLFSQRDIDVLKMMRYERVIHRVSLEESVLKAMQTVDRTEGYDYRLDLQGAIDAIGTAIVNLGTATASTQLSEDKRNELVEVLDGLKVYEVTLSDVMSSH